MQTKTGAESRCFFCILLAHFTTPKSTHANYYGKQKVMAQSHIDIVFTFIGVLGQ